MLALEVAEKQAEGSCDNLNGPRLDLVKTRLTPHLVRLPVTLLSRFSLS